MTMNVTDWMRRYKGGEYVRVFLDGVDITTTDVVFADDESGIVIRYKRDEDGKLRPGPDGDLEEVTVVGKVEFVVEHRTTVGTIH